MDKIDARRRSANMGKIKAKNTKPELIVRKFLFSNGIRYRIHFPLKGKPDLAFPNKKVALFVNGCFWHGHGCKTDHKPKSNIEFWEMKIKKNMERDEASKRNLESEGWNAMTLWECEILTEPDKLNNFLMTLTRIN